MEEQVNQPVQVEGSYEEGEFYIEEFEPSEELIAEESVEMEGLTELVPAVGSFGPDMELQELLTTFFNTAIIFATIVAVFFLIYGGFQYMSSGGDSAKTEDAQRAIGSVLIGLVVCLTSGIVVRFVLQLLNVDTNWL